MELPASEIEYWKQYYSIFPFPQNRDDARVAEIIAMMLNVRRVKPSDKYWTAEDFLPDYLGEKKPKTIEDAERAFVQKALESGVATMDNNDHST